MIIIIGHITHGTYENTSPLSYWFRVCMPPDLKKYLAQAALSGAQARGAAIAT
jgi:hypothetical protein